MQIALFNICLVVVVQPGYRPLFIFPTAFSVPFSAAAVFATGLAGTVISAFIFSSAHRSVPF